MWKSPIPGGCPEDPLAIRLPGGASWSARALGPDTHLDADPSCQRHRRARPGGHRFGTGGGGRGRPAPGRATWAAGGRSASDRPAARRRAAPSSSPPATRPTPPRRLSSRAPVSSRAPGTRSRSAMRVARTPGRWARWWRSTAAVSRIRTGPSRPTRGTSATAGRVLVRRPRTRTRTPAASRDAHGDGQRRRQLDLHHDGQHPDLEQPGSGLREAGGRITAIVAARRRAGRCRATWCHRRASGLGLSAYLGTLRFPMSARARG